MIHKLEGQAIAPGQLPLVASTKLWRAQRDHSSTREKKKKKGYTNRADVESKDKNGGGSHAAKLTVHSQTGPEEVHYRQESLCIKKRDAERRSWHRAEKIKGLSPKAGFR